MKTTAHNVHQAIRNTYDDFTSGEYPIAHLRNDSKIHAYERETSQENEVIQKYIEVEGSDDMMNLFLLNLAVLVAQDDFPAENNAVQVGALRRRVKEITDLVSLYNEEFIYDNISFQLLIDLE